MGYAFVMTMIILVVMDYIPGLSLRVSEEGELVGVDEDQIGELAMDYIYLRKELSNEHYGHQDSLDTKNGGTAAASPSPSLHEKKAGAAEALPASNERAATAPTGTETV